MDSNARWAVAIVEPQRDHVAEQNLRREGYRVIFLYRRKLLTGHDRSTWRKTHAFVFRPLFEGYGFVQLCPGQEWPDPAKVVGFDRILGAPSPILLQDDTVFDWQRRAQLGKWDDHIPQKGNGAKFRPANSEEDRRKVFDEFMAKISPQYAVAS